jgi:CBS domain containing-hemolysin-like protein
MSPAAKKKKSSRKKSTRSRKAAFSASPAAWFSLLVWPLGILLLLVYAAGVRSRQEAKRQNQTIEQLQHQLEQEEAEAQLQVELLENQLELAEEQAAVSVD